MKQVIQPGHSHPVQITKAYISIVFKAYYKDLQSTSKWIIVFKAMKSCNSYQFMMYTHKTVLHFITILIAIVGPDCLVEEFSNAWPNLCKTAQVKLSQTGIKA